MGRRRCKLLVVVKSRAACSHIVVCPVKVRWESGRSRDVYNEAALALHVIRGWDRRSGIPVYQFPLILYA